MKQKTWGRREIFLIYCPIKNLVDLYSKTKLNLGDSNDQAPHEKLTSASAGH